MRLRGAAGRAWGAGRRLKWWGHGSPGYPNSRQCGPACAATWSSRRGAEPAEPAPQWLELIYVASRPHMAGPAGGRPAGRAVDVQPEAAQPLNLHSPAASHIVLFARLQDTVAGWCPPGVIPSWPPQSTPMAQSSCAPSFPPAGHPLWSVHGAGEPHVLGAPAPDQRHPPAKRGQQGGCAALLPCWASVGVHLASVGADETLEMTELTMAHHMFLFTASNAYLAGGAPGGRDARDD